MARTKYQVFVSSTYRGLEDERRLVMQALLEMDCIPSGMELFPAANEEVWKLIESVIAEADYYVLIIGGRYGSTDTEGISFTEREHDLAVKLAVPVLPFLHGDPGKIPAGQSEMSPGGQAKLAAFRVRVEQTHHCKYWTTAEELAGKASRALGLAIRTTPRVGWVRADLAKTVEEVERTSQLQQRVRELEEEIQSLRRDSESETSAISQGDDAIPVEALLFANNIYPSHIGLTWNKVFVAVAKSLIADPAEYLARDAVVKLISASPKPAAQPTLSLRDEGFRAIKHQFLALGLISADLENRAGQYMPCWHLTQKGRQLFARLCALKRPAPTLPPQPDRGPPRP